MRKLYTLYRIELTLVIREISGVLFGVFIPVGLALLFGALYGDSVAEPSGSITRYQQVIPGVLTIGICASGLMGLPLAIANYRDKRILRRFQVTPTSPLTLLAVQFLVQATLAIFSAFLVLAVAYGFFGYAIIGNPFLSLGLYGLLLVSIFAIGMAIASIANNTNTASLLAIVLYFPMFLLSGATIPYDILPTPLQHIAGVFPLTQGILLLQEATLSTTPDLNITMVWSLVAIAVLFTLFSYRFFRYDY